MPANPTPPRPVRETPLGEEMTPLEVNVEVHRLNVLATIGHRFTTSLTAAQVLADYEEAVREHERHLSALSRPQGRGDVSAEDIAEIRLVIDTAHERYPNTLSPSTARRILSALDGQPTQDAADAELGRAVRWYLRGLDDGKTHKVKVERMVADQWLLAVTAHYRAAQAQEEGK